MSNPVLVRAWDSTRHPIGHAVVPFAGGFTLPDNHPLAKALFELGAKFESSTVTVLSTDEVEWHVKSVRHHNLDHSVEVECKPNSKHVRDCLVTDDWFLSHLPGGEPA